MVYNANPAFLFLVFALVFAMGSTTHDQYALQKDPCQNVDHLTCSGILNSTATVDGEITSLTNPKVLVFSENDYPYEFEYVNQTEPYISQEFNVTGVPSITVRTGHGSIRLVTSNENKVRVELYVVRRGLALLSGDRVLDDYHIVIRQRHNEITAEVINKRGGNWSSNAPNFNFVIHAPKKVSASLNTLIGDVDIDDVEGALDIRSSAGNISINGSSGSARVNSRAGNIKVESFQGIFFSNSLSGDLNLTGVKGELRLRVVSGNVTMKDVDGSIIVHCTNGNISLVSNRIDQLVDLESVVGNVNVSLPQNLKIDFNVQGQRVDINQITNFSGQILPNSIVGKLNNGGVPVRIKSQVGNVQIQLKP